MNLSIIRTRSHSHSHHRTRSVSFPARSHPSTIKIEQVLNKIKTLESSFSSPNAAEEITHNAIFGLVELYKCIKEFLVLPLTQRALQDQDDNLVMELLERSVKFIYICSNTRDTIMLMKAGLRELQTGLRRSKNGDDHIRIQSNVRRNTQKEITKSLTMLKLIDNTMATTSNLFSSESQLCSIIRVLVEAKFVTISTCRSKILTLLSMPVLKRKPTKWSLVSKIVHKRIFASEMQRKKLSELENMDIALNNLLLHKEGEAENIEFVQRNLETLDSSLVDFENGLEQLFRLLIRTRVSLLNTLSQ